MPTDRPAPPEGYETWLDKLVEGPPKFQWVPQVFAAVRAELEDLRLERERVKVTERILRRGLAQLGKAMEARSMDRIRATWGGNTPEDWCYEADALSGLLDERERLERERDEAREQAERAERDLAQFDEEFVCPECKSYDVVDIAYEDDFGSMRCLDCDYAGEPGEDFPTSRRVRDDTDRLQAEVERLRAAAEHLDSMLLRLPFDGGGLSEDVVSSIGIDPWGTLKDFREVFGLPPTMTPEEYAARASGAGEDPKPKTLMDALCNNVAKAARRRNR